LDWGDKIEGIVLAATGAGVPLSDLPCVTSRVDPFPHLTFDAAAFYALSSDRAIGFDRGPIPWRSIYYYGERYGLSVDEFDRFAAVIRAMDGAYLAYLKKSEA
jgi:hypothetical protein